MAKQHSLDRKLREHLDALTPVAGKDADGHVVRKGTPACAICGKAREGSDFAPLMMAYATGLLATPVSIPVCAGCEQALTHREEKDGRTITFTRPAEVAQALLDRVYGPGNAPQVQFQVKGEFK